MIFLLSLLIGTSGTAQAAPDFTASVPASGDDSFPTNGSLWLYGRDLTDWPQEIQIPTGFPRQIEAAPWIKNPELNDLWREPRRVRWRKDHLRKRLKQLVPEGSGIALVESVSGKGISFSAEIFPVTHRPPLHTESQKDEVKSSPSKNSFELLIIRPETDLMPNTDYALVANGELVAFSTGPGADREPPTWEGITEIRHESENNSVYEANPVEDNAPFATRVEIYRGKEENVRLRQFALVGSEFKTGRLSPLNQSCVYAKAVDVAGNETEMLPCFKFPPVPNFNKSKGKGACDSSNANLGLWTVFLAGLLIVRRSSAQASGKSSLDSSPSI